MMDGHAGANTNGESKTLDLTAAYGLGRRTHKGGSKKKKLRNAVGQRFWGDACMTRRLNSPIHQYKLDRLNEASRYIRLILLSSVDQNSIKHQHVDMNCVNSQITRPHATHPNWQSRKNRNHTTEHEAHSTNFIMYQTVAVTKRKT